MTESVAQVRTFLVMTVPPPLTIIVQWLILRMAVRNLTARAVRKRSDPVPH
jgi:hypothetical protein